MIWRGPMMARAGARTAAAPDQLRELDYLIVDMPPGTGDIRSRSASACRSPARSSSPRRRTSPCSTRRRASRCLRRWAPSWASSRTWRCTLLELQPRRASSAKAAAKPWPSSTGVDYLGALPLAMSIRQQADSGQPTRGGRARRQIATLYKDGGAPGGGEDRAEGEGLQREVPDHHGVEGDLRAGRRPAPAGASVRQQLRQRRVEQRVARRACLPCRRRQHRRWSSTTTLPGAGAALQQEAVTLPCTLNAPTVCGSCGSKRRC